MDRAGLVPGNRGVLRYLGQGEDPERVAIGPPTADVDIFRLGAHPDIVDWLWETLNASLPADARCLIGGGAALVDPASGRVIAAALGTQYAVLLTGAGREAASEAGYATVHAFRSVDRTLDLAATFGPGWYFGRFERREGEWLAETCRAANL